MLAQAERSRIAHLGTSRVEADHAVRCFAVGFDCMLGIKNSAVSGCGTWSPRRPQRYSKSFSWRYKNREQSKGNAPMSISRPHPPSGRLRIRPLRNSEPLLSPLRNLRPLLRNQLRSADVPPVRPVPAVAEHAHGDDVPCEVCTCAQVSVRPGAARGTHCLGGCVSGWPAGPCGRRGRRGRSRGRWRTATWR